MQVLDYGGYLERAARLFGDAEAETAGDVRQRWEQVKVDQEARVGIFHDVPDSLPALLYARKVLRRVDPEGSAGEDKPGGPKSDPETRAEAEHLVGTLLLEAVTASRKLGVDPELALRQATQRLVEAEG